MTTEEAQAAAVAENLKNPDGTDITTEEQLLAARELAANPPEEITETPEQKEIREQAEREAAAAEDPLLKVMLQDLNPLPEEEKQEVIVQPAPEPAAEREKNLATLKEWGVAMPANATDEAIAAKVVEGKPVVPAAAPPAEPKPKRKKFSVVKKESAEIIEPAHTPAAPPVAAAAPPAPEADAEYVKTLTPEQQDELYEAEVAEMLEPAKFKGQRAKLIEFFKKFDTEVREIQAAEPGIKVEESDRFQNLVKAKPTLDAHIVKKVNREIGSREGQRRANSELAPKIESIEITQRRADMTPKFQKFIAEEFKPAINILIESDQQSPLAEAIKVIKEKGVTGAAEEGYKLEARIYSEETDNAARVTEKFLLYKNNAMQTDPQKPDPDIQYVSWIVEREGRGLAEREVSSGIRQLDKARTFLPRAEFMAMLSAKPDEYATLDRRAWKTKSYCTLTDTIILDCIARYGVATMENRIKVALKNATEVGFERRPVGKNTVTTTPPAKPPVEINPPRATPSAANGAGKLPPSAKPRQQDIDVLATNYPHLVKR